MVKTFTRSDVLSWRPCHGRTQTLRIMEGLPRILTALDVLRHEAATPADRLWCVLRPEVISVRTLRLFAAWCARTALEAERAAGREPDPRSWHAVDVAERHAVGQATEDELRAAAYYSATGASAYAARAAAAYAAADTAAAAYAAAAAAAYAAADAADATRAARRAAAYNAVRAAQVERLIQITEENEK